MKRKYAEDYTFNILYLLRYVDMIYVRNFSANIQKQWNVLKINLLFKKFTNFMTK